MNRLFIFLFSAICVGTQAQTVATSLNNTSEAYWNIPLSADPKVQTVLMKSQTNSLDPTSASNAVSINQQGLQNQAILKTAAGTHNQIILNQFNNGNSADAMLSGTNNSLIMTQTGGSNNLSIGLSGTNNRFTLTQDGGDSMRMQGLQKDNTRLELSQGAGNNSFTLDNSSLMVDPLSKGISNVRIEQSGGSRVTVQQGKLFGN